MQSGPTRTASRPEGLLLIDKPAGITSHDVIRVARRVLDMERIGHAGTLDPDATGLLLLLLGRTTRLLRYIDADPKEYEATICFGSETDTDDASGSPVRSAPPPSAERILMNIAELTGELDQFPPSYSARKLGGTRAYRAARRGRTLDLAPRRVTVTSWSDIRISDAYMHARITCSGGTYIRALARDLGRLCGSAAHLSALRRTRIGPFHVDNAIRLDALTADAPVVPPAEALGALPHLQLCSDDARRMAHGVALSAEGSTHDAAVFVDECGEIVAIAERRDALWWPRVVLAAE